MRKLFVLDGETVRPARSADEWAERFQRQRRLMYDVIGDISVSTVFIGVNDDLFETRVIDGSFSYPGSRSSTYAIAKSLHEYMLSKVLEYLPGKTASAPAAELIDVFAFPSVLQTQTAA